MLSWQKDQYEFSLFNLRNGVSEALPRIHYIWLGLKMVSFFIGLIKSYWQQILDNQTQP